MIKSVRTRNRVLLNLIDNEHQIGQKKSLAFIISGGGKVHNLASETVSRASRRTLEMLKKLKQATLATLKTAGAFTLVQNSKWRRQRLLILAYHGISLSDEHIWNGSHFISAEVFRSRLQLLRKTGCVVLPLDEALKRLYENDLPDRAVAITFDDGTADFYSQAFPLLKEFELPVTLYLTTFYSRYQKPVFDLICSYLLWKGRHGTLDLKDIAGRDLSIELRDPFSRETASLELRSVAAEQNLSAEEKEALASSLAAQLNVDYDALLEQRVALFKGDRRQPYEHSRNDWQPDVAFLLSERCLRSCVSAVAPGVEYRVGHHL